MQLLCWINVPKIVFHRHILGCRGALHPSYLGGRTKKNKTVFVIQILTGVEVNIDYLSPRGTKYCSTRSGGNLFVPKGANIINLVRKHYQHLFCYMMNHTKNQERIWKQIVEIFSQLDTILFHYYTCKGYFPRF